MQFTASARLILASICTFSVLLFTGCASVEPANPVVDFGDILVGSVGSPLRAGPQWVNRTNVPVIVAALDTAPPFFSKQFPSQVILAQPAPSGPFRLGKNDITAPYEILCTPLSAGNFELHAAPQLIVGKAKPVLLKGCGVLTISSGVGDITIDSVNFGLVPLLQTRYKAVTIRNNGKEVVKLTATIEDVTTIVDTSNVLRLPLFLTDQDGGVPQMDNKFDLAPGSSKTCIVGFHPTHLFPTYGILTVFDSQGIHIAKSAVLGAGGTN